MKPPNLTPFLIVIFLIAAGIIWFIIKRKQEKKTTNVRPYTRTITVPGHKRNQPKSKRKNRRSSK